ncbi:MAG: hypothetical protein ACHP84_11330 [Caulobacterales bacterium]
MSASVAALLWTWRRRSLARNFSQLARDYRDATLRALEAARVETDPTGGFAQIAPWTHLDAKVDALNTGDRARLDAMVARLGPLPADARDQLLQHLDAMSMPEAPQFEPADVRHAEGELRLN